MNFRDHADRDTFPLWFILTLIAERDDIMKSIQSGDVTDVPVKLIIGGHEIDAEPALVRLDQEFDRHVDAEAERLAASKVDTLLRQIRTAVHQKVGLDISEES